MDWNRTLGRYSLSALATVLIVLLTCSACSISYSFNGGALDYSRIKTLYMPDVTNQATRVYPPLAQTMTEALQNHFTRRTKLEMARTNDADMIIEVVITNYDFAPLAVQDNDLAARTKVTLSIQVHYENKALPEQNFDRDFTSSTDFDSSEQLVDVQDALLANMVDDLVKQGYNATVENW